MTSLKWAFPVLLLPTSGLFSFRRRSHRSNSGCSMLLRTFRMHYRRICIYMFLCVDIHIYNIYTLYLYYLYIILAYIYTCIKYFYIYVYACLYTTRCNFFCLSRKSTLSAAITCVRLQFIHLLMFLCVYRYMYVCRHLCRHSQFLLAAHSYDTRVRNVIDRRCQLPLVVVCWMLSAACFSLHTNTQKRAEYTAMHIFAVLLALVIMLSFFRIFIILHFAADIRRQKCFSILLKFCFFYCFFKCWQNSLLSRCTKKCCMQSWSAGCRCWCRPHRLGYKVRLL